MQDDPVNLADRLARIEVKLDAVLANFTDHETRLRTLEKWKYALPVAFLGTLSAALAAIFGR